MYAFHFKCQRDCDGTSTQLAKSGKADGSKTIYIYRRAEQIEKCHQIHASWARDKTELMWSGKIHDGIRYEQTLKNKVEAATAYYLLAPSFVDKVVGYQIIFFLWMIVGVACDGW